jgi:hypothetical protein
MFISTALAERTAVSMERRILIVDMREVSVYSFLALMLCNALTL